MLLYNIEAILLAGPDSSNNEQMCWTSCTKNESYLAFVTNSLTAGCWHQQCIATDLRRKELRKITSTPSTPHSTPISFAQHKTTPQLCYRWKIAHLGMWMCSDMCCCLWLCNISCSTIVALSNELHWSFCSLERPLWHCALGWVKM